MSATSPAAGRSARPDRPACPVSGGARPTAPWTITAEQVLVRLGCRVPPGAGRSGGRSARSTGARPASAAPAQQAQQKAQLLEFADRRRAHGVPDLPEPTSTDATSARAGGSTPQSLTCKGGHGVCGGLIPDDFGS